MARKRNQRICAYCITLNIETVDGKQADKEQRSVKSPLDCSLQVIPVISRVITQDFPFLNVHRFPEFRRQDRKMVEVGGPFKGDIFFSNKDEWSIARSMVSANH